MPGKLEINTLGGLHMRLDGRPFTALRSRKVAALLVYLAYTRRPQPRELLAEMFWEDRSPHKALTNLRVALYDLRRHLAPFMQISRQDVAISDTADIRLDATALLARLAAGDEDPALLREALAAYQGEFLAGFFLRQARGFDHWSTAERESIHRRVLDAYNVLGQYDLQRHAFQEGIPFVRRWLQLDPLAEDGHRLLMQMSAAAGRQAEALDQFETLRQVLDEELAVEPSPESAALAQQIAAGQWSPPEQVVDVTPPAASLPADLTPFIGRKQELEALEAMLLDPGARLVSITGPGGMGKTRLALAAARRQVELDTFSNGVAFVPVTAVDTAAQMTSAIAGALGLVLSAGGDQQTQLQAYLRGRSILLVLDNLEQVSGGADYIADLLRAIPWLKLMVTSRERLWLQAEHVLNLAGLPYAGTDDEPRIEHDAAQLFLSAARRARVDFTVDESDRAAIAMICRLVEGMPLALELAAGRVDVATPAEIAAEIEHSYDFLATMIRDMPARHRSMQAIFESTWASLNARLRDLLAALSLFRGGCTRSAIENVTGATTDEISLLTGKNLLRFEGQRYDIHELLRQFAAQKLATRPELESLTRAQHSQAYCQEMAWRSAALTGPDQDGFLDWMELETGNLRQAWRHAADAHAWDLLQSATNALGFFLLWRNQYNEGLATFDYAVAAVHAAGDDSGQTDLLLARLLLWQGVFTQRLRQAEAEGLYRKSLALLPREAVEPATLSLEAWVRTRLGNLLWADGQFADAQSQYEDALINFEANGDGWGMAASLAGLGDIANSRGAYARALQLYGESLDRYRAAGDRRNTARIFQRMSYAARDLAQIDLAERYAQEALELLENSNDREQLASAYLALGWLLVYQGRFSEALAALERSDAIFQELALPRPVNVLAIIHQELGHYDVVWRLLENQIAVNRSIGEQIELALSLNILCFNRIVEGRYAAARSLSLESIALLKYVGQRDRLGQAHAWKGYAEYGLGNSNQALDDFSLALEISLENMSIIPLLFAVPGIALILAEHGRIVEALRIYAPLARMPLVANSQMRADLAGKRLSELSGIPLAELGNVEESESWSPWDAAQAALEAIGKQPPQR